MGRTEVGLDRVSPCTQQSYRDTLRVLLPFAALGLLLLPAGLVAAAAFGALFFTAQLGFHASLDYHLIEAWPPLALLIGWGLHRYVLSPDGEIAAERSRRFAVEASRTPSHR